LRPKCLTSIKVSKQQGFVRRLLPYQAQVLALRKPKHGLVALLVPAKLVAVQEHRSNRIADIPTAFVAGDLLACEFDQRKRVASARPE
jgi:hypothetical protein